MRMSDVTATKTGTPKASVLAARPANRRRGSVVAEFIMVLPVLVTALLGTIEFSMLLTARQQLLAAAQEGARVWTRGGNEAEVDTAVAKVLGYTTATVVVNPIPASPPNTRDGVEVLVEVPTTNLVPNLLPMVYDFSNQQLIGRAVMSLEFVPQ